MLALPCFIRDLTDFFISISMLNVFFLPLQFLEESNLDVLNSYTPK